MEDLVKIVREELESTETRILTKIKRIFIDGNQASAQRNMKLQFNNRISQIRTGEEIKGDDKNPLEVVLVDESTGSRVVDGPESSATVKILLLKGVSNASEGDDWTIEQFNENIVQDEEGKLPLLAGSKLVKLQNGICFLGNIKFRHHATKTRPPSFKLGARVVGMFDGVLIKEAKTESFVVKDFRNKYYIKHENPSLSDEVSRLVNIRKGGKIEGRLQDHKICSVEDFLIRLLIDPEGLKRIVSLAEKKWERIVNNAKESPRDKRMYFYSNEQKTMGVVFNLLGQILGLYMERQYSETNLLSEKEKADAKKLLESAYKNWERVKLFDDEDLPQQYFNSLGCPITNHENAQTSEMIRESCSRSNFSLSAMNSINEMMGESSSRSNFSVSAMNSISEIIGESSNRSNFSSSAINSINETGVEDFSSFGTDDVEFMHDAFLQLSPFASLDFDNLFPDFDDYLNQNGNPDMQLNGLVNEWNADEFVESKDVRVRGKPQKRWRKLLCVSKWFSIRKKVSVQGIHNRKKQKVSEI